MVMLGNGIVIVGYKSMQAGLFQSDSKEKLQFWGEKSCILYPTIPLGYITSTCAQQVPNNAI